MAAQLVHADLERDARAGGGPLEHQRHALPLERARGRAGRAFSSSARSRAGSARRLVSSSPVRKWRVNRESLSWNLYHGRDFPPDPALLTWRSRLLRLTERDATHAQVNRPLLPEFARLLDRCGLGRGAAPGGAAALVRGAGAAHPLERRAGAHVAQPPAGAAVAAGRPQPRPDRLERGRLEPDPRAPPGASPRRRRLRLAERPERRRMLWARVELPGAASAWRTCTRAPACRPRRPRRWSGRPSARSSGRPATRSCFGGDFNLRPARDPEAFAALRERLGLGDPRRPRAIDHLLARGLDVIERPRRLEPHERELRGAAAARRIRLSDHAPVARPVRAAIVQGRGGDVSHTEVSEVDG